MFTNICNACIYTKEFVCMYIYLCLCVCVLVKLFLCVCVYMKIAVGTTTEK